ncbi:MAG: hypothetical protein ACYCZN_14410 [Candidatus Dormibacteria bacterium]
MGNGRRARADLVARRINAAAGLLASGLDIATASRVLASRQRLSERQGRRYVERARDGGAVEVPSAKVVFTVKLPEVLASRVRQASHSTGQSISAFVSQALAEFLGRQHPGGGHG